MQTIRYTNKILQLIKLPGYVVKYETRRSVTMYFVFQALVKTLASILYRAQKKLVTYKSCDKDFWDPPFLRSTLARVDLVIPKVIKQYIISQFSSVSRLHSSNFIIVYIQQLMYER